MPVPTIVLVGADKGGVGKTTVARALCDYLTVAGTSFRAYDTEWPAGDLKRFVPASEVLDVEVVEHQMKIFDGADAAGTTVVDLRAGTLSPTIKTLDATGMLDDVRTGTIGLVLLHVLGPTMSSISEVASAAATIGGATHLIVKNHVNATRFFEWEQGEAAAIFARYVDVTVNVPQLTEIACETIQKRGGSFIDFIADASQSRHLRGLTRAWLRSTWAEFDRVGLNSRLHMRKPEPAAPETPANPT